MTNYSKLSPFKLGLSGGIVSALFVLLVEVYLWIAFIPSYNQMIVAAYGESNSAGILSTFLIILILALVLGFVFCWLFAWIYNKLLKVRVK
jgi:hypothetical protein|tara:strand:- start:43 stop:315 length:273 start_codon:yes stop_codon:yes gene_type:complete